MQKNNRINIYASAQTYSTFRQYILIRMLLKALNPSPNATEIHLNGYKCKNLSDSYRLFAVSVWL